MMPERILDAALSHAVRLVLHRKDQLGAGLKGPLRHSVRVGDVKADAHRCTAQRLRAQVAHLRRLIYRTELRVADR